MLKSDADIRGQRPTHSTDGNMDTITMEAISEIEKELLDSPCDMISLVFLLYDVPDTALQRLLVYQRVSEDIYATNMNLLREWMLMSKSKPTWREEFLEALLICQLYGIVRKLGLSIQTVKRQYQPDNIRFSVYVNRTKKTLYKLCENMDTNNFNMIKQTLHTYNISTDEYDTCELVFLKLMSEKIINLTECGNISKKSHGYEFNLHKLLKLIQKLPGLELFANELSMIENQRNGDFMGQPIAASSPSVNHTSDISTALAQPAVEQHYNNNDFEALYDLLGDLNIDESDIKSDSKVVAKDRYPIKDRNKIGLCLIINQEVFHFCDQSIEDNNLQALSRRTGSTFDKIELEKTMSSLNFEVITENNLNYVDMYDFIKKSVKKHVKRSTSIFMLCIMSHGVRGHIYTADSLKVKIEDIQNLLDSDELCLLGIPKVLIIQACQPDDIPQTRLVADSPSSNQFRLRKMDFLVYWATSPELKAFRSEEAGSIFIQFLCNEIRKRGKQERLDDIFTKVNFVVSAYCKKKKVLQAPVFLNSLIRKLYLYDPE